MAANPSQLLTDQDLYLFNEGSHVKLYEKLGAHPFTQDGVSGYSFAVWAPNAAYVSVIGDFNGWDSGRNAMDRVGNSGIWATFVPNVHQGNCYKYHISTGQGQPFDKSDPYAFTAEVPPKQASVAWPLDYEWNDGDWMSKRREKFSQDAPVSIYEIHFGSWKRKTGYESLSYREMAHELTNYVKNMGFTHVEFLPLTGHPYYGSWGYQVTGYFATDSRYGTPQDFMYLIDTLHQNNIGVILDWVPSHFATDPHGLAEFDGTHLYEHGDPKQGFHPDWGSFVFNYGRHEVRSFLLSSALYWLDKFHFDGLRVDAVASMLYLDYSRKHGEWVPNKYGTNENLESIDFLKRFNVEVYKHQPDVQTIAEESTSWPMVSRPTEMGGLGFGYKWDMGWMHDTLKYCAYDPIYRRYHQNDLTFRMLYAFTENYVLPLSHDEVVHGKGPLYDKCAGDAWQKMAGLRVMYSYMFAMPGKKLLFMGSELGQRREWNHDRGLDWDLLKEPMHQGLQNLVRDLNKLYRDEPALHELDCQPGGFTWIDANDADASVYSFIRRSTKSKDVIVCLFNYLPTPRHNYRVGVPGSGDWKEILNSDAEYYGGGNLGNMSVVKTKGESWHGQPDSIEVTIPPLGAVYLKGTAAD